MPRQAKKSLIRAFDCETIADRIVLFLRAGVDRRPDYLYNPHGLEASDILQWMTATPAGLNIAFFFDFDVNQILRQLPPAHLEQLRRLHRVRWRRWRIRHIPNKRFTVTDLENNHSCTIWDVAGWAQCSFMRLADDWKLGSTQEREIVRRMKARRQDLSTASMSELVQYTTLECALLSEWADQLIALHGSVGISLRSYSGPGSTAAAMLHSQGWRPPAVPPEVARAAEAAFFGGRSETSLVGPASGPVYSYDINSAYPAALSIQPELHGARWHRTKTYKPGAWGFYRVRWRQKGMPAWGFFPLRGARLPSGRRSLSLLYPQSGNGWYHSYEVQAALRADPSAVTVMDGWIIEPKGEPFAWVEDVAAERLRLKANDDPAAFPLKVGLNSLYGKLAQHTGSHPYQSMAYASAITAWVRARMLPLLITHQHDILLVATDGILARLPLDLPLSPALGDWDCSIHPDAWILQAGVYWTGPKIRTRGIDGRSLSLDQVRDVWSRDGIAGRITVPVRRVVSYRSACARGAPQLTGTWEAQERVVSFNPHPRRRPWISDQHGAILTLPGDHREYLMQAALDQLALCDGDTSAEWEYDGEAMPDWALE